MSFAKTHAESVFVGDHSSERTRKDKQTRLIDINDAGSVEAALDGVSTVVACVRQLDPHLLKPLSVAISLTPASRRPSSIGRRSTHLLRGAAHLGAYHFWDRNRARRCWVLVQDAVNRLGGHVDSIETALLLSLGDDFGGDSTAFIFDELAQTYTVMIDGRLEEAQAFDHSSRVSYPEPFGVRRAYRMPFTDQLYYPKTLGAKTAIARISLDPLWLADLISGLTHVGLRSLFARKNADGAMHKVIGALRARYTGHNGYSLVVEARGDNRIVRATLTGHEQDRATALAVWATTEALHLREVVPPGVWLAEQALAPDRSWHAWRRMISSRRSKG